MTIKQQLIPLRIGQSLLSLVALFVMLLAPQRAWAQTEYGLTVAGVAVTSENASNVLSDQETPTVVFTPATEETAATLTLNGARFTGCVQWTNSDPLIVNFVGTSIITLDSDKSEKYAFVGNGGVLTFMTTSSTPLLVRNTFESTITNGWAQGSTEVAWNDESATWYLKQTQTSYELTLYKNAETYNLTVARVAVTEANASDVLGDGKVSYDSKTNKLTLNGATIAPEVEAAGIDYKGGDNLTISFSGTNSIAGAGGCSAIRYNGTSQTPPTLTFESSSASSTLTLTETSSSVIRYFSSVLGVNGINDATGNVLALTGGNVSYDAENGLYTGDDQNTVSVTSATITSGYGLAVGGVVVFADNASHILGDNNTTVTFNASNNILTLNGADFVGNIRWISANNLTVEILGNNIIDAAYSPFFQGNSNANLILTTNSDNPGDLHLTRCYSNNVMSGWKNNNSVYYNKETSSGAATDYGWWADAISDQTKLRLNKVYDLWVDNVQFCDAQNEVSFDPEDYSGNRITYADGKLKFQTVSKTTENSPFIVNGLSELTILLVGNNTLNCGALFLGKKTGDTDDHKVTFTTEDNGSLVITTTGTANDNWFTGHNAPTYEGLALVDEMKNNVRTLTISEPISYDLEVAGVSVTSANATNITGDYITGTVSFDASNNTLTLDGATIDLTEMEGPGISYTGTANLTISLIGTNSIKTQSACEPIICETPLDNKPTLTFERGSSLCSLELQTSGTDPVIRNFGNVLGVNGINEATGNVLKLDTDAAVAYSQEDGLHTVVNNETTPVTSAKIVSVLKDPEFCFYVDETISNGETKEYEYGLEQTLPELKRWDNGSLKDPTGFNVTYTSSDQSVATIDDTGKITIVGGGWTEIRASIEATGDYAADEAWFTMEVIPAVPQVSIQDGAYFTGQKLTLTRVGESGSMYYSFGYKEESDRSLYDGEISLPAGEYLFYPYTRCGTSENSIWSVNWPIELYVYDEPTISKDAGEYEGDIEVEITNLPNPPHRDNVSVTAYYYLGDDDGDEENDILYTAGNKITVRESTKLNVYLLVEGDSGKSYKTRVIERQYVIKDIPLDVTAADFHNHWMTYYHNNNGNVGLPEDQNIGAYVATTISGNDIVVTQIKSIPRGEPVLLNDETTTTTTNVFGQDVQGNLLRHADEDHVVDEEQGDYYGLYNGAFMHVKGTIPAGKNYLMVSNAVVPGGNAPQLTIVIDGEATGVNDVRSKMEDVRGDIYDLQGRKVQKPSKKGLYINKGHKVVIK